MLVSDLGDHIGMESSLDLNTGTDTDTYTYTAPSSNYKPCGMTKRRSSINGRIMKELPPPLPIQTSTVLKRYYTDDGRLIIAEEKVESPKYQFTAHRSQGRLTLRLVEGGGGKVTVGGGGGGGGGGVEISFGHNATVKVVASGPCLVVDQNQHRAITPVQI